MLVSDTVGRKKAGVAHSLALSVTFNSTEFAAENRLRVPDQFATMTDQNSCIDCQDLALL
jgi:hypothetical protein